MTDGRTRRRAAAGLLAGLLLIGGLATGAPAGAAPPEPGDEVVDRTWQVGSTEEEAGAGGDAHAAASGDLDVGWSGDGITSVQTKYFPAAAAYGSGELGVALYKDGDGQGRFRVWDFTSAGQPDPTFGPAGLGYSLATFRPGGVSFPTQTIPYDGGQIVVGSWNDGSRARVGITRLRSNGTYRSAGSYTGRTLYKVFANEHDYIEPFSAAVYGNGRVMVAVAAFDFTPAGDLVYVGQGVIRVNGVGSLDPTFSGDGFLPVAKEVGDITFRSDGGTYMGRKAGASHEIRKLLPNGALDPGFSGDGRALVPCGTHFGADLQADTSGRIVVGCVRTQSSVDLRMARMTTGGVLDPAYSGNGLASLVVAGGDVENWSLLIDPLGRTYVSTTNVALPSEVIVQSLDSGGVPNGDFSDDGLVSHSFPSALTLLRMTTVGNRLFLVAGRGTVTIDLIALEA